MSLSVTLPNDPEVEKFFQIVKEDVKEYVKPEVEPKEYVKPEVDPNESKEVESKYSDNEDSESTSGTPSKTEESESDLEEDEEMDAIQSFLNEFVLCNAHELNEDELAYVLHLKEQWEAYVRAPSKNAEAFQLVWEAFQNHLNYVEHSMFVRDPDATKVEMMSLSLKRQIKKVEEAPTFYQRALSYVLTGALCFIMGYSL